MTSSRTPVTAEEDVYHRPTMGCGCPGPRVQGANLTEMLVGIPNWPDADGRRLVRRESRDGPRYVEAVRGARVMRTVAACWAGITPAVGGSELAPFETWRDADADEKAAGIPVGWWGRP